MLPSAAGAQVTANGAEAREDTSNVAVEDGKLLSEGDAENGSSSVSTDAGELEQCFSAGGKHTALFADNPLGGFLEIVRAGIVAETRPKTKDFFVWSFGERLQRGESLKEAFVIGHGSCDASLLEHDFRQPNAVGILGAAPRKVALELMKPAKKIFAGAGEWSAGEHAGISVA